MLIYITFFPQEDYATQFAPSRHCPFP